MKRKGNTVFMYKDAINSPDEKPAKTSTLIVQTFPTSKEHSSKVESNEVITSKQTIEEPAIGLKDFKLTSTTPGNKYIT